MRLVGHSIVQLLHVVRGLTQMTGVFFKINERLIYLFVYLFDLLMFGFTF